LDHYTHDVGYNPVKGQAGLEIQREEAEHQGHHPQHHLVGGCLLLVDGRHGRHLLHQPHRRSHQYGEQEVERHRLYIIGVIGQLDCQELAIQRHNLMNLG